MLRLPDDDLGSMWEGSVAQQVQSHRRGRCHSDSTSSIGGYGCSSGDEDKDDNNGTSSSAGTSSAEEEEKDDELSTSGNSASSSGDEGDDGSSSTSSADCSEDENKEESSSSTSCSVSEQSYSINNDEGGTADGNEDNVPQSESLPAPNLNELSASETNPIFHYFYWRSMFGVIQEEMLVLEENMASSAPNQLVLYPRGLEPVRLHEYETHAAHVSMDAQSVDPPPQPSPRNIQKCKVCGQPRKYHICTESTIVRNVGTNTDPCKDAGSKISISSGISIISVSSEGGEYHVET